MSRALLGGMAMEFDERVRRVYDSGDEDGRLWQPGVGTLIRLRTWDLFDRLLPAGSRTSVGVRAPTPRT